MNDDNKDVSVVKTSVIIDKPVNQIGHKDLGRIVVTMASSAKKKAEEAGGKVVPKYRLDLYAEVEGIE